MVLQQEKPMAVWGWAEPGETVTVQLASEKATAKANEKGEWQLKLPSMEAGGPYTMTVSGSSTVEFDDVMVGEVWLCSGQSNMEMGIGRVNNAQEEIAAANYPKIRLLMVPNRWTPQAQEDIAPASWKVCSPKTIAEGGWDGFSAAGYFFGRDLYKKLDVPIGLIEADWGGTRIEPWTPPEGFAAVSSLRHEYEEVELADPATALHRQRMGQFLDKMGEWLDSARQAMQQDQIVPVMPAYPEELRPVHDLQQATALYNGMIHPLCPFTIRGAIWYQGESNYGTGRLYTQHMKALVRGWRELWGEGNFPFYFVQIAPFNYGGDPEVMGEFWEAQAAAAEEIPDCGMAVINDIGNVKDIHPKNKQEVGRRLALLALAKTYGESSLVCSGPTFKSMETDGDKLRVTFDDANGGLKSRDGKPLDWFEIIDRDEGGFVKADAEIDGDSVLLSSPEVEHPVAMRFAWSMLAEPNLENGAGLPASAFRAGRVPKRDLLEMKVPEAKDYQVLYDLDLAKLGPDIHYDIDNRAKITGPVKRIAYFLELQRNNGVTEYLYVSMTPFTQDLAKMGIPTYASGAHFQENVSDMDVYSNVRGVAQGTNLKGGNIEFWPNNYGPENAAHVPHASSQLYDFGDQPSDPTNGYGCMQVHNHAARQTLFALNHWSEGSHADLGIGNQHGGNPDWTFAGNAGEFIAKRLRVLVERR